MRSRGEVSTVLYDTSLFATCRAGVAEQAAKLRFVRDRSPSQEIVAQARRASGVQPGVAGWAGFYAVAVGAGLLAWVGTPVARVFAAAALLGCVAYLVFLWVRDRRRRRDVESALVRATALADADLAERLRLAQDLARDCGRDPALGSAVLASVHLERMIAGVPLERVCNAARARRTRATWLALVFTLAASSALIVAPVRVAEGLDVLMARADRAPVPIPFLEQMSVVVRQPAYLGRDDRQFSPRSSVSLPVGSELRFRGIALRERPLFLTDGVVERPFRSDGEGGLVATWDLTQSATLEVIARFGDVAIAQPGAMTVVAVEDGAPQVTLSWQVPGEEQQRAPGQLQIERGESVTLNYRADDDHGLRQIALVLQAGAKEERRVLRRLDGGRTEDVGVFALSADDKFIDRAAGLPVRVVVAARDNDGVYGSKWGESPALTLLMRVPGAAEAERLEAFEGLRADLTRRLGVGMVDGVEAAKLDEFTRKSSEAFAKVRARRARLLASFLRSQARKLQDLPLEPAAALEQLETVVLALDSGVQRIAWTDARAVSKRLSELADQVAIAAFRERTEEGGAEVEMEIPLRVLHAGTAQLRRLGTLGEDLGSVAEADLIRLERARAEGSLDRVEAVARHIAGRLRRPNPSFGAKGGSGKGGGVESGSGEPSPGDGAEPSSEYEEYEELMNELNKLTDDHERAMREPKAASEDSERERAMAERAQELLDQSGESKAALPERAKERVEDAERAMRRAAEELRQGREEAGRRAQEDAQEQLEQAAMELAPDESDETGEGGNHPRDGRFDDDPHKSDVDVPGAGDEDPSGAFRRRVVRGLGDSPGGALSPAIRRYQEGLLR